MEQILQDALFLANVCNTLQISGYLKQELIDEHPALIEHINEATARIFVAAQTTHAEQIQGFTDRQFSEFMKNYVIDIIAQAKKSPRL